MTSPTDHLAYIALGANLGNREQNLNAALRAIGQLDATEVVSVSPWLENLAVGGPSDSPAFLNGAAAIRTKLEPLPLLDRLLEIERSLGRVRDRKWEPRPIDLDLLLYDDQIIDTSRLQVPHPLMQERAFVLVPLAQIAPNAVHPRFKRTIRELLSDLDRGESPQ